MVVPPRFTRVLPLAIVASLVFAGCSDGGGDDGDGTQSDAPTPSDRASPSASKSATASQTNTSSPSSSSSSSTAPPPTGPQTIQKDVRDNSFPEGTFTVRVGDTVTWTHRGNAPHSVTSDGNFDSHPLCPPVCMVAGQTFSHTFKEAGVVEYRCKVHDGMTGTITVT